LAKAHLSFSQFHICIPTLFTSQPIF